MEDPAQDQHLRKKRREDLLKLHFRDLPPEDQLRLLRELIGHMEYDLLSGKDSPLAPPPVSVDDSHTASPAKAPAHGRTAKHKSMGNPGTRPEGNASGSSPKNASPARSVPDPAANPGNTDAPLAVPPASPGIPRTIPPAAPLFAPDAPGLPEGEADWEPFDREMDAILHAGGELNHIHRLRLKDAMDRYASLLKKNGYIKGLPGIPELVRKAQAEEQTRLAQQSRPEWNSWVAKDQETLDRPLSHQWADWLLPGTDDEEGS